MTKTSRTTINDDRGLLRKLARREEGAADAFVCRYRPFIWTLARRRCANPFDAEDAVQEILLELWRTAGRFDPELGSESNFIATVARRRLIDRLRRQQTRPLMEELPDAAASSEASPERQLIMSGISRALAQLKPDHRQVLEMSLFQGHTHVEIADAMEIPLGTVKTITRRTIQRMRANLGQVRIPIREP